MFLNSQNIALLGLGKENLAFLAWLIKHNYQGKITVCDQRKEAQLTELIQEYPPLKKYLPRLNWRCGQEFNQNLEDFEVLFRSPGWPISCPGIQKALNKGVLLSSAMEYFFAACPSKNTIGVTGSKGKGTTASIIAAILKKAGKKVFLGGNIGIAPFSFFDKIKKSDWVVMELSSFQLEDLSFGPRYAIITNIFKEHLSPADPLNPNYHHSYSAYWQAKLKIAKHPENKLLVANHNLQAKLEKEKLAGKIIYFEASELTSRLQGIYNQENIGAAVALSRFLKIPAPIYKAAIKTFKNLKHRLEFVGTKNGVKYFDNSFSTTPESTALDLISFTEQIILIAGGADKGANFKPLAKLIAKKVKALILLQGAATPRLLADVKKAGFKEKNIRVANNMAEAVNEARKNSVAGDVILLSTACASFGIFKNYKERGNQFKYYAKK
ncbi:MAG: UDP-N-acetylmuramoyl-L-alanine--D-glutamate ligase [Patescibacteria group bacterium]|nr:UDP-N-acetylmuramoyl-L-alanine--D-glutamate ligase [Patescibacteria group bacterium]